MPRWRNPFASLFSRSRREEHLAQYVVRECSRGRTLADVLDDPYVRNRSTSEERARLFERPEVITAVGEHVIAEMRAARVTEPQRAIDPAAGS